MVRGTAGSVHFRTMLNGRVHHTVGRCRCSLLFSHHSIITRYNVLDPKMCECSDWLLAVLLAPAREYMECGLRSTPVQVLASSTLLVVLRCTVQYPV